MLPRINGILLLIIESGLIDYWTRTITREQEEAEANKGQKILRLENLQGCFYLLALGWGVSLVAFIVEIIIHHRKKRGGSPE